MEFISSLIPHYKEEFFESSMDLYQLDSRKYYTEKTSISPLSESNRAVPECVHCDDRPDYECMGCTCQICGHKTKAAKRFICCSCKKVFHEWCQNITEVDSPDHWQCLNCKPKDQLVPANDLVAVKFTRQIIIRNTTTRKINNAPRSSECTSVPANHFGPIPDIPVGTCWEYRLQVSEAGVHRPLVAGIHGRENEGAYSIVLSGVYPDDFDRGDEFFYSGCGGKEKDPSKRLGAQVRNQTLTKHNRALALCCDCPINDKEGGTARNWRAGKPVRVIRNYKLAKFSKYAPKEGNRYDGIYKVVKYFPQKGRSGFMIWRYFLKRDDPTPAPWTSEGKRLIKELGLKIIRASPSIAEKAEEYETTFKMEINDEEPMKKKLKKIRFQSSDFCIPQKRSPSARSSEITLSSPEPSPKAVKSEEITPTPSPEPEALNLTPGTPQNENSSGYFESCETALKSSPTQSPNNEDFSVTTSEQSHDRIEEISTQSNVMNSYLQITSMSDSSNVANTYSNSFPRFPSSSNYSSAISNSQFSNTSSKANSETMQNEGSSRATDTLNMRFKSSPKHFAEHDDFTSAAVQSHDRVEEMTCQSSVMNTYLHMSSISDPNASNSYSNSFQTFPSSSSYSPALPCPSYLNMSSTSSSYMSTYSCNDVRSEPRIARPLPILKVPLSNLRCIGNEEMPFKPIKLTKPVPIILKATNPTYPEPLHIERFSQNDREPEETVVMKKNGRYELTDRVKELISKDVLNKYWWDMSIEKYLPQGKQSFLENVQQMFTCPCCVKIIDKPVTLRCEHSACFDCLYDRFEVMRVKSCPACQEHLGLSAKLKINDNLYNILMELFPAYNLKLSYFI